jgi:hypothetical protein
VLTVYWLGFYTRLRDDIEVTSVYLKELKGTALLTFVGLFAAWIAPPEDYIELILSKSGATIYLVFALYNIFLLLYVLTPFVPALTPKNKFRSAVDAVKAPNRMKHLMHRLQALERNGERKFKGAVEAVKAASRMKQLVSLTEQVAFDMNSTAAGG